MASSGAAPPHFRLATGRPANASAVISRMKAGEAGAERLRLCPGLAARSEQQELHILAVSC